jgi:hypothetical protein
MCPDKQILSAYIDGEIGQPWKKNIDQHISHCPSCKKTLKFYRSLRQFVQNKEVSDEKESRQRVWNRLNFTYKQQSVKAHSFWFKRVSLPLPAAGIAAMLLCIFGISTLYFFTQSQFSIMRITTEPSGITEIQVSAPAEDLEMLLKSLDNTNFQREVQIQLPEGSEFYIQGEPVLLRAEDIESNFSNFFMNGIKESQKE